MKDFISFNLTRGTEMVHFSRFSVGNRASEKVDRGGNSANADLSPFAVANFILRPPFFSFGAYNRGFLYHRIPRDGLFGV